jgi:raffinose/stachyose/melibiose transport system substrate-binding protein
MKSYLREVYFMKKKVLSMAICTAMVAGLLAACGGSSSGSSAAPAATDSGAAAPAATADAGSGRVYVLNQKPESADAWTAIAKTYTEQTGVPVEVKTAAAGTYATELQSEMAKSEAPTIFNVGNTSSAQTWNDYTYDLKDSSIYEHLSDKSLCIEYDGKIASVANCYECYGIIYNKTIVEDYCTMDGAVISSPDDIKDLDTLIKVAEDINSKVDAINEEFGYELTGAFASAGLDDGSSWRFSGHLANMPLYYEFLDDGVDPILAGEAEIDGTYLDNYKKVWDLYVGTSSADPKTLNSGALNAESELGMEEAVFYQNGDWNSLR